MKDAYEVLQQKQAALDRVRKEVESLKIVATLLADDSDSDDASQESDDSASLSLSDRISRLSDSASTNADELLSSVANARSGFWNALKRAK
jgi:hypothetical protein